MSHEPPPAFCVECRENMKRELNEIDRRVAIMETRQGRAADELKVLFGKIDALKESVDQLRLAQAQAVGAMQGASWVSRILWALFGAAVAGAIARAFIK